MYTLLSWRWPALGLLALAAFAPAAPVTTLSGHLAHAPAADSVRLEYGTHRAATVLSPAGNFAFALTDLAAPVQATFSYGDQHTFLWLSPGDQQHLPSPPSMPPSAPRSRLGRPSARLRGREALEG